MNESAQAKPLSPDAVLPGAVRELPLLLLRNVILFPQMMAPLVVVRESALKLVEETLESGGILGFVTQRVPEQENPAKEDLYTIGCAGTVLKMLKYPDGSQRILVQGIQRFYIRRYVAFDPLPVAEVELLEEDESGEECEVLSRNLLESFRVYQNQAPNLPPEIEIVVESMDRPGRLADFVASNLNLSPEELQNILEHFRTFFPEHVDKTLYGILAMVDAAEDLRQEALSAGIFMAGINDEQFKLEVPKNFQPKAW